MSQSIALFLLSAAALVALIAVKKQKWVEPPLPKAEIQYIGAPKAPQSEPGNQQALAHKAAAHINGKYYLDREITAKWFLVDNKLQRKDVLEFLEQQPDVILEFDGSTFRLEVDGAPIDVPYKPLEVTETYIRIALPIDGSKKPKIYFIQWDKLGFWLSRYTSFKENEPKILFRQRFVRL